MKAIVFDTGPVISLTMNNLLWLLEQLKGKFAGKFYIPLAVKKELIDRPLATKMYKFEALQVMRWIRRDVLEVFDDTAVSSRAEQLLNLANKCFKARGNWIKIVHPAEMESIAAALHLNADALIVDERTTRVLIEDPSRLARLLGRKLHANIHVNRENVRKFRKEVRNLKLLRSIELVAVSYELGFLNEFIPNRTDAVPDPVRTLLESVLWGVKLDGCAVSKDEIEDIIEMVKKDG